MARKVDPDELVSSAEVATMIGLTNPRGVSVYRRYDGFPSPIVEKGRCLLWLRSDIERWVKERTR